MHAPHVLTRTLFPDFLLPPHLLLHLLLLPAPTPPSRLGSQPQWAICGETYPLGCRFSPHILGAQYFTANPDRRRRLYNTQTGIYGPGCGLLNVSAGLMCGPVRRRTGQGGL